MVEIGDWTRVFVVRGTSGDKRVDVTETKSVDVISIHFGVE